MKRACLILFYFIAIVWVSKAQTETSAIPSSGEKGFSIGITGGMDYNINAYKLTPNEHYSYTYTKENPGFNVGLDLGLRVSAKLRPRLSLKYVNVKYGIDWSTSSYDFENTILGVSYFDAGFYVDYLVFSANKIELFVSPGIKYEYEKGYSLSTKKWNILETKHPSSILGGALGGVLKYKLSGHWALTFSPEYNIFLHSFATGNDKPYQRFSTNIGIDFKF